MQARREEMLASQRELKKQERHQDFVERVMKSSNKLLREKQEQKRLKVIVS